MNNVFIIGRLTKDVEVRYQADTQMAIGRFSVAVDRKQKEKSADFIPVVAFGNLAELCEKYVGKGNKVAVRGRMRSNSYQNKEGKMVYTIDVIADEIEFLEFKNQGADKTVGTDAEAESVNDVPTGFNENDIPF